MSDWLWGRAEIDGITVLASSVRFNESQGEVEDPLLYVVKGDQIYLNAIKDEIACLEGVKIPHPDTNKKISGDCIYIVENEKGRASIRFNGQRQIIASFPFTNSSDDWETWYARFLSDTTLDIDMNGVQLNIHGHSTLENMDFFGRKKK